MSSRAITLPIRTRYLATIPSSQWVCKRCLATQINSTTPIPQATSPGNVFSAVSDYDPTLPASKRIGPDGKPYRLNKADFNLKKPLPQAKIPTAYLQHSTSEILPENEKGQREQTVPHKRIVGVVVSAGKMDKTVKVRVETQTWNKHIKKYFRSHENFLTHDPNSSLIEGDVVELHRLRVSRRVGHVVSSIVSPFGGSAEERAPIPSPDERLAAYKAKRFAKLKRRELRSRASDGEDEAAQKLQNTGLDPGSGLELGARQQEGVQQQAGQSGNLGEGDVLGEKG